MQVSRHALYRQIWRAPLNTVAARYGLTGNGLAKICDRLSIPRPDRTFWKKPAHARNAPPELPPAPVGLSETVELGKRNPRRPAVPRSRMTLEDRREKLMAFAERIAIEEGLASITIRRVAKDAGISETQVHNCFGARNDLLVAMARRATAALEAHRRERIARNADRRTRIVLSTIGYLHQAAEHGPLLQILLRSPAVREALSGEREERTSSARAPLIRHLTDEGLDPDTARASTAALTAVSLRAGGIVSARRAPHALVEHLCLSVVLSGVESDSDLAAEMRQFHSSESRFALIADKTSR